MALVHDNNGSHRSKDLHVCGLALVIIAIVAAAVPVCQGCVNMLFGLF
jgi:hypothetical protein